MGLSPDDAILPGSSGVRCGTLFMTFPASRRIHLGLPRTVQSRPPFGDRGAAVLMASGLHAIVGGSFTTIPLVAARLALPLDRVPSAVIPCGGVAPTRECRAAAGFANAPPIR